MKYLALLWSFATRYVSNHARLCIIIHMRSVVQDRVSLCICTEACKLVCRCAYIWVYMVFHFTLWCGYRIMWSGMHTHADHYIYVRAWSINIWLHCVDAVRLMYCLCTQPCKIFYIYACLLAVGINKLCIITSILRVLLNHKQTCFTVQVQNIVWLSVPNEAKACTIIPFFVTIHTSIIGAAGAAPACRPRPDAS